MSSFDETHGSSVHARMASRVGEEGREPVDDQERAAKPGDPPEPGAQWDELHRRWERWDDKAHAWVVVGGDAGDGVEPTAESPLPSHLTRVAQAADDLEASPSVQEEHRLAEPGPAPRGAQWNEVAGRWERWDDASGAWRAAAVDDEPPAD